MTDCLIIGGGVVGLSIAYELSQHGLSVRVIDRVTAGKEASWAGAGILPPANLATAVHPIEQLRGLSHELHPRWAEQLCKETGIDTGYRECGGVYVARSVGEAASLAAMATMLRELDITIEQVNAEVLADIEPALAAVAASELKAAYVLPGEAQLRNPDHLGALLVACRQRGVDVSDGVEARGFQVTGNTCNGVETDDGLLTADRYCVTSGAWTYALLQQLGITTGIMPIKGQMVLFKCKSPPFRRVINEGPRYLVPRDDGRVLVGSTEEETGFDKGNTVEAIDELCGLARSLVPDLRTADVERTWAGLRPGSFDGFPYVGAVPGLDNVFAAAGHFRSGLHLSPGTAVVMSQLIRGEQPQIDLAPFDVGRG